MQTDLAQHAGHVTVAREGSLPSRGAAGGGVTARCAGRFARRQRGRQAGPEPTCGSDDRPPRSTPGIVPDGMPQPEAVGGSAHVPTRDPAPCVAARAIDADGRPCRAL